MSETNRRRYVVRGRVQGVGYRAFARDAALSYGVSGWVRNRPDGSVELEAEASPPRLAALEETLRLGPPMCRVASIDVMEAVPRGLASEGFEVVF